MEAHLTLVLTGPAIARYLQGVTNLSIRKIVQKLRPLQDGIITVNGHEITATPQLDQTRQRHSRRVDTTNLGSSGRSNHTTDQTV